MRKGSIFKMFTVCLFHSQGTRKRPTFHTKDVSTVRRPRPIAFNWREGGSSDIGFAAEEVNEIEPLLVTSKDKGEIEGVKYAQITAVLVNAANKQQKQIEEQRDLIKRQQSEIADELEAFICSQNPAAVFCVEKKR